MFGMGCRAGVAGHVSSLAKRGLKGGGHGEARVGLGGFPEPEDHGFVIAPAGVPAVARGLAKPVALGDKVIFARRKGNQSPAGALGPVAEGIRDKAIEANWDAQVFRGREEVARIAEEGLEREVVWGVGIEDEEKGGGARGAERYPLAERAGDMAV